MTPPPPPPTHTHKHTHTEPHPSSNVLQPHSHLNAPASLSWCGRFCLLSLSRGFLFCLLCCSFLPVPLGCHVTHGVDRKEASQSWNGFGPKGKWLHYCSFWRTQLENSVIAFIQEHNALGKNHIKHRWIYVWPCLFFSKMTEMDTRPLSHLAYFWRELAFFKMMMMMVMVLVMMIILAKSDCPVFFFFFFYIKLYSLCIKHVCKCY